MIFDTPPFFFFFVCVSAYSFKTLSAREGTVFEAGDEELQSRIHMTSQPPNIIKVLPPTTQLITKEVCEKKAFALSQHNQCEVHLAFLEERTVSHTLYPKNHQLCPLLIDATDASLLPDSFFPPKLSLSLLLLSSSVPLELVDR